HVAPMHAEIVDAKNIDVDEAVAVDVSHRDPRLPSQGIGYARASGDVFELVVTLVEVQSIGAEIRREVQIGEAVVVDVAHSDPAAIVVIEVIQEVEGGVFWQRIHEGDAAACWRDELEERCGGWRALTAGQ